MAQAKPIRALATLPGILALAAFGMYILLNGLQLPDVFPSVLAACAFGILACLAVLVDFRHWRIVVLVSALAYVVIYLIRVGRMLGIGADAGHSLGSGFVSYYTMQWRITAGTFQEKGALGGGTQFFLEYVMPVLVVVLIAATLLSLRSSRK